MKYILISTFLIFISTSFFAQEELTVLDLFSRLPEGAFDGTCEGVTSSEPEQLIIHGKAGIWEVTKKTKSEFKFSAGDQSVTVLKIDSKKYQMAIVHTQCAQTSNVKIWAFDPNNSFLVQKDILPEVVISDFYSKEDLLKIPKDYKFAISLYLYESKIDASLWTWMESALENVEVRYNVFFYWDGENFIKKRKLK